MNAYPDSAIGLWVVVFFIVIASIIGCAWWLLKMRSSRLDSTRAHLEETHRYDEFVTKGASEVPPEEPKPLR